jgi:hypothetical protein
MKKQLQEVIPRSARSVAPQPAPTAPAAGGVMSLDDLSETARSQHVEESLERTVLPQPREEAPRATAATSTVTPQTVRPPKPATKMIATPIDAQLRQRVRDLRGQYEISEAFVVETALRAFLADRPLADVAADLRARGGRLRRNH